RDEVRPRFGAMRSREFLMKDAYSFDLDRDRAIAAYQRMFVAYLRTFHRMGLKSIPMRAETGPIGGDLSHEFIVLAETGESAVFCHADLLEKPIPGPDTDFQGDLGGVVADWTSLYSATGDIAEQSKFEAEVPADKRISARGIEVGQVFYFGTKYSEPMGAVVTDAEGRETPVHMGSYGIGLTRVVPAIIEASHDEAGIVWPVSVAPFEVALINLKPADGDCAAACEKLEAALGAAGLSVLHDDRDAGAGDKFATADLIGLPFQLVVGPRGLKSGEVEIKRRATGKRETVPLDRAVIRLAAHIEPERRDRA
ncbi:MAG: proline--tRNA ligase, partial [Cucumibacter sp.]